MASFLKPISTSSSDFAFIRRNGHLYVDKTAYVQRLLKAPDKFFFLARPRRFGKSLFVSTLAHLHARDCDDLFLDTDIHRSGFLARVPQCPVLALDMSGIGMESPEDAYNDLRALVDEQCLALGLPASPSALTPWSALNRLLLQVRGDQGVVVLIDEYDAPITDLLGSHPPLADQTQRHVMQYLRYFYRTLKRRDDCIRFAFITGITRFSSAGMFSALNSLVDISSRSAYHALCGFTEAEISAHLADHVALAARNYGCSPARMRAAMQRHYNGYRFIQRSEYLYNPISYLRTLEQLADPQEAQTIRDQGFPRPWVDTGKPHFLFQHMKAHNLGLRDIGESTAGIGEAFDLRNPPLNALMFQAGYLTLRANDAGVRLDYPNQEVRASVKEGLLGAYLGKPAGRDSAIRHYVNDMAVAFEDGDSQRACARFDRILDQTTYGEWERESNFQIALHIVCAMVRGVLNVESEVIGRRGRADSVVETEDAFYVFELKRNKTVKEAIDQIVAKGYGDKYRDAGKAVIGIGLNFIVPEKSAQALWEASAQNFEMQEFTLHSAHGHPAVAYNAGPPASAERSQCR